MEKLEAKRKIDQLKKTVGQETSDTKTKVQEVSPVFLTRENMIITNFKWQLNTVKEFSEFLTKSERKDNQSI